jgi:hypothetical protein
MVGSDGRVHVWNGSGLTPVSTPPVEAALATYTPTSVLYYELRGHGFICVTFSDASAWCYDIAMGEWHEREQAGGAWQARQAVLLNGVWHIGCQDGKIAKLNATCADFGANLTRKAVSKVLDLGKRVTLAQIEAFPRVALDTQAGAGTGPATISLRTSQNGIDFGPEKTKTAGNPGEYSTRLVWRALGQFRRAVVQFVSSSQTELPISAQIDVEIV